MSHPNLTILSNCGVIFKTTRGRLGAKFFNILGAKIEKAYSLFLSLDYQLGTMVENDGVAEYLDEPEIVYLNNAGQARFSDRTKEAGIRSITENIWIHAENDQQEIRSLFAQLIHASAKDIAIMPSTAFAITLAATNIAKQLTAGEVLVLQDQMCSAIYPWQEICNSSDGRLKLHIVPYPSESSNWTDDIVESINSRNIVVACLPPLHWSDGSPVDLTTVSQLCSKKSIPMVIDATQAVGIMACNISEIRPVLLACSSHKWLRGPSGASLVYIDASVHEIWQPLDQHGRGRDPGRGDTRNLHPDKMGPNGYDETFFDDARKFDAGGKPNSILLPLLRSALEDVVQLDIKVAQDYLQSLMLPLIFWASLHDFAVVMPRPNYHIVGLRPKSMSTEELSQMCSNLERHSIYVAARCGALRISPYHDNKPEDIIKLIKAMENACTAVPN